MSKLQQGQLREEIKLLVRGANFAHLATLMRDGSPHVDPVWVDLEGETINHQITHNAKVSR